jgi:hypothetical protein
MSPRKNRPAATPRDPDPETPAEWQDAVDAADFFIAMDSCQQYGLITGGPRVNCERARELLDRGRALGYTPAPFAALIKKFLVRG